ncbi:MAG: hypothetical protein NTX25_21445 [Proteobacteria bacterium]|nr:hypothetical protein [Pseudomonadota bacterium]
MLDIYQNPAWHSYGGLKASIEVHLNLDTQSEVVQAHIFYLNGMRRNIAIFSSHGINVSCVPQQELSSRDRRDILMHVLGILLGLRQVGRTHRLDSIIQYGLNKLLGSTQKID